MIYKVIVSPSAMVEFREIHAYVKQRFGKSSSERLKRSYKLFLKALTKHPLQYEEVPERIGVRKCAAMAPTLVYYKVDGKVVTVLRIQDGRQG